MLLGICRMCLQKTTLVSSHFLPRLLYDYCRKEEHRPIRVGDGVLIPTDRQTQDYLLCEDCEHVLSDGGEAWIGDKLATWERTFPFYDLLTKVPPLFDENGSTVYLTAQNPDIEVKKLVHFALGIFWKASVHRWKGKRKEPRIDLGPYSESIRKWLQSEGPFPDHLHLVVIVEKPARAQITMSDPYEGVRQGWRTHFFHVPGILFMLAVGKTVSDEICLCAVNTDGNPIHISEALTDDFEKLMVKSLLNSRRTDSFLRAKAKADADRKKSQ